MFKLKRSFADRRSGKDRRKIFRINRIRYGESNRRVSSERRSPVERREGWVKTNKWSSVEIKSLKIAKYLKMS